MALLANVYYIHIHIHIYSCIYCAIDDNIDEIFSHHVRHYPKTLATAAYLLQPS